MFNIKSIVCGMLLLDTKIEATRQLAFLLQSMEKVTFRTVSPLHNYKEYIHRNRILGNFWPWCSWLQTDNVWEGDSVRFTHCGCQKIASWAHSRVWEDIEILPRSTLKFITLEQKYICPPFLKIHRCMMKNCSYTAGTFLQGELWTYCY